MAVDTLASSSTWSLAVAVHAMRPLADRPVAGVAGGGAQDARPPQLVAVRRPGVPNWGLPGVELPPTAHQGTGTARRPAVAGCQAGALGTCS